MKNVIFLTLLLTSINCLAQDNYSDKEITTALILLNKARKAADLDTISISASLSKGCYQHAKYLAINRGNPLVEGMSAHEENKSLEGYSEVGAIAGKSSVIHYVKPIEAISGWLQTFYHRIPLLQPNLKTVGIAFYEKDGYVVSLIDCISGDSGFASKDIVYYPNKDQGDIPLLMGNEIPNPTNTEGIFGFPITIYFTQEQKITDVTFKLSDKDKKDIPCYISTPEKPATYFTQWNTICAIPIKALAANNIYTVTVVCKVNGVAFVKKYSFRTINSEIKTNTPSTHAGKG